MTYPADSWASTGTDALGGSVPPGLRNRRRYALYQAFLLADQPVPDPVEQWQTTAVDELLTLTGRRPAARDLTGGFDQVLELARRTPGGVWTFKGTYAVVGVHAAGWSVFAAVANPQRIVACFDTIEGLAVEYGGAQESSVERVLLEDCVEQLAQTVAAALAAGDPNLAVFPPRARRRAASLAAEVTGQPYPYELPEHARSTRRP